MVDIGVGVERWLVVRHLFFVVLEVRHDQKYVLVCIMQQGWIVVLFDSEGDRRNLCI